jgi:hypothetical protein
MCPLDWVVGRPYVLYDYDAASEEAETLPSAIGGEVVEHPPVFFFSFS